MFVLTSCKKENANLNSKTKNGITNEYDTTDSKDTIINFPVKDPAQSTLPVAKDGRFQIPLSKFVGTDLWITLPKNFAISPEASGNGSAFYIFDKSDPSLKDKSATVRAFARLQVTSKPPNGFAGQSDSTIENVVIAAQPLQWKVWEEKSPNGDKFYLRELNSPDFFAGVSPEQSQKHIALYIYLGGTDAAKIKELVVAVNTLSMKP